MNQPLEQLAWLVGEWVNQDENATIRTQWEWAKNRRFLTGSFSVSVGDAVELRRHASPGLGPCRQSCSVLGV